MVSNRIPRLILVTPFLFAASFAAAQSSNFVDNNLPRVANADETQKLTPQQRGDVFMARKMYREAIDTYLEGSKTEALIWNKVGIAYHQLGQYQLARKSYEKAVKLDPKYSDAINNIGTVYYAEKKYRSAISRYKKSLAIKEDSASVWGNLGTAYYARGKFDDMFNAYKRALELDPLVFEHRNSVGVVLQERTVADRARYHYELARMYAHTGQTELALQYLRKSLEEGFKDKTKLHEAPEFAAMRKMPEFQELLALEPRVL